MSRIPTQDEMDAKLLDLGNRLVHADWKARWTPERPATGYCYIVTEVLWHYGLAEGRPEYLKLPEGGTHWYLRAADGTVTDLTASQFETPPDYSTGKSGSFYPGKHATPRGLISERGYLLAQYLGYAGESEGGTE